MWEKKKTKLIIKDQHRWVCVCGSDTDSDGLLIELFLLTNAWISIIIESNGFIYMIVFQMHVWRCSFRSSSEQLQDQFSHRDSDWPRFLYDSLSLCEHITIVDPVSTLTVIMSSIFSLDSTDGQSEICSIICSIATESRWSSWLLCSNAKNEEFRSFSRFLQIPVETGATTPWTFSNSSVSLTVYSNCFSWLNSFCWGSLSHRNLSCSSCEWYFMR